MKILAFAASLRKDSFNRKLISQAANALEAQGMTVDHADFRDFEMPMYDGDFEDASGLPPGAREFVRRIQAADALVISAPEYNGGISGALKNAIDWASRQKPNPFDEKPVLLLGATLGGLSAVRGLWHTRVPLEAMGAYVYPEMFGLAKAHEAFASDGNFVDAKNGSRIQSLSADFIRFSTALAPKT